ncbi:MAG: YnbE family lipoprotein [Pseudomonadota bacterium]
MIHNTDLRLPPAQCSRPGFLPALLAVSALAAVTACTPRVVVEAPSDPITINLNVKIDQEVRVKLDKEVEDLIAENPDLF